MESYYAHPRIRSVRTFAVKTTIRIVVYYEKNNAIFGHGPLSRMIVGYSQGHVVLTGEGGVSFG